VGVISKFAVRREGLWILHISSTRATGLVNLQGLVIIPFQLEPHLGKCSSRAGALPMPSFSITTKLTASVKTKVFVLIFFKHLQGRGI
jgi:hypothetical protein